MLASHLTSTTTIVPAKYEHLGVADVSINSGSKHSYTHDD